MSNAKQIDQLLEGFLKRGLPGCGLKVVQYGNTLYEGYFGVTDIDIQNTCHERHTVPSGIYVQNSALHSYDDAL